MGPIEELLFTQCLALAFNTCAVCMTLHSGQVIGSSDMSASLRRKLHCLHVQVYLPAGPAAWYKITDALLSGAEPLGEALKVSASASLARYLTADQKSNCQHL